MTEREKILRAIAHAEAEIMQLNQARARTLSELKELHSKLAAEESQYTPLKIGLNKYASTEEKIWLFANLFRGREDVFARYWFSQKSGKKGYSPVCEYEWQPGVCTKPEKKCTACKYAPLTHEMRRAHLEGKHVLGVYPLRLDETCYFLAVDFDKDGWQANARAFLETCKAMNVPAVLERSRSGNGGHVWIFFAEPVPASLARNLGSYLLTETISQHHQLGMDSYDRFFPNQDTMPKGGFGNLIALPLQKEARKLGNTEFLNEQGEPFPDQWMFLASIHKMDLHEIQLLANEAAKNNRITGVAFNSEEENAPWAASRIDKKPLLLLRDQLPSCLRVVIANLLYIEKKDLPSALLAEIKRLASFQNPKFYEAQKMRRSTFRIPRIISCAEELPKHLALPRGCWEALCALLEPLHLAMETCDERFTGTPIEVEFHGDLTDNQKNAVEKLSQHDMGMFVAPPGSGKTVVGVYLLAQRKVSTLILVHRKPLLEQWQNQVAEFLHFDKKEIGQIGGGKDSRTGKIDVAMLQSLTRKGKVDSLAGEYGHVIIDECHHVPAFSFEQVLKHTRARYVTGLTATPYRRDGHHPIISMYCGPLRHRTDHKTHLHTGPFRRRLTVRYTNFTLPENRELTFPEILQILAENDERNDLIVAEVLEVLQEKRALLLLTERRRHVELLRAKLGNSVKHLYVLHGGMSVKDRNETLKLLNSIPGDQARILLATGSFIGEGFDDPRLDTLFLAMPISFKGKLEQYAGRILRECAGKQEVRIYDYVDCEAPMLARMFAKRLKTYRVMGFEGEGIKKLKKRTLIKAGSLELPLRATG